MEFRALTADEIECRIGTVKEKGLTLLLYKDARCDMNILDETVGNENWQRYHEVINGNLFCNVGIKCGSEWVYKQDVGVESYAEKEKGEASDSFKRACVNWGIGRELYTAPFIWIPADKCKIEKSKDKLVCYDKFVVTNIVVLNKKITGLEITNESTKEICFSWGNFKNKSKKTNENIICEGCGEPITDFKGIKAEEIAARTKKTYNKKLCFSCAEKEKERKG